MTGPDDASSGELDVTRVICAVADLGDPDARGFTMGAGEWPLRGFVVRRGDIVRAYVNHCPHAGFPLNWQPDVFLAPGEQLIRCIMHGALFDIESGDCVAGPCLGHALQPVPVHVRDGCVVVDDGVPLQDPN